MSDVFQTEAATLREGILKRIQAAVDVKIAAGYEFLSTQGRLTLNGEVDDIAAYLTGGTRPVSKGFLARGGLTAVELIDLEGGNVSREHRHLVRKDICVPSGLLLEMQHAQSAHQVARSLSDYAEGAVTDSGIQIVQDLSKLPDIGVNAVGLQNAGVLLSRVHARQGNLEANIREAIDEIADQAAKPIWLSADLGLHGIMLPILATETMFREKKRDIPTELAYSMAVSEAINRILLQPGPEDKDQSRISQYQQRMDKTLSQALVDETVKLYGDEQSAAIVNISQLLSGQVYLNCDRQEAGWLDKDAKPENVVVEKTKSGWKLYLIDQGCYTPAKTYRMTSEQKKIIDTGKGAMTPLYTPYRRIDAALREDGQELRRASEYDDAVSAALSHAKFFGAFDTVENVNPITIAYLQKLVELRREFAHSSDWKIHPKLRGYLKLSQTVIADDLAGRPWKIRDYKDAVHAIAFQLHGNGD